MKGVMAKAKVTDFRKRHYPEIAPERDYPPLRFTPLSWLYRPGVRRNKT